MPLALWDVLTAKSPQTLNSKTPATDSQTDGNFERTEKAQLNMTEPQLTSYSCESKRQEQDELLAFHSLVLDSTEAWMQQKMREREREREFSLEQ